MESLDKYISGLANPFDEEMDDQESITLSGYIEYKKDSIYLNIGKKECSSYISLFHDDLKSEITNDEYRLYLDKCIEKLCEVYKFSSLYEFIERNNLIYRSHNLMDEFFVYIEKCIYVKDIAKIIPKIDSYNYVLDNKVLYKLLNQYYYDILANTKKSKINKILKHHIMYSSKSDTLYSLYKLIKKEQILFFIEQNIN